MSYSVMIPEAIFFLFNAASNRGRTRQLLKWLKTKCIEHQVNATITIPDSYQEIDEIINNAISDNYNKIIVCGGDGTLNKVVSNLYGKDINLGLIPMGSGNDFSKSLRLPNNLNDCFQVTLNNKIKSVDVLSFKGDAEGICVNTLGFGFDGWTNYYAQRSWFSGDLSYSIGALRAALSSRSCIMKYIIDNDNYSRRLLMITACNGMVEGGGFPVAPEADISDGKMDLLILDEIPKHKIFRKLHQFKRGEADHLKEIQRKRCTDLIISSETPQALHCDGEEMGTDIKHLEISVIANAVKFLVQ